MTQEISRDPKQKRRRTAEGGPRRQRRLFWPLMLLLTAVPLVALSAAVLRLADPSRWAEDRLLRFAATRMTAEDRQTLHDRLAATVPGLWTPVPEAEVTYLLQPRTVKVSKGAEVRANGAGLRSRHEFTGKREDRYRIVCLGDSLVMGTGGREEDRWGDQMEAILAAAGVRVDGKPVEVYSVGLDGWTAINEATYLSSRISAYRPDLVLVLTFRNDITDSGGVLGNGLVTYGFSSESRADGSGIMIGSWPNRFGVTRQNLLSAGLGSESRLRWRKTFAAWKRLEDLVAQVGGKMLFSFLQADELFGELCRLHHRQAGMRSPVIATDYFGKRLPHDPHPNREGHRVLAAHYLHALSELGWLPVTAEDLPPLDPRLTTKTERPPDAERIAVLQAETVRKNLDESIVFDRLRQRTPVAFLGGIYPGSAAKPLGSRPFGSTRSAFLLRRKKGTERVLLEIDVPSRVELYPFEIAMRLGGEVGATLRLETSAEAGRHLLTGKLPDEGAAVPAVEVLLTTDSYWTEIHDPVMKSYRLVSVRQE